MDILGVTIPETEFLTISEQEIRRILHIQSGEFSSWNSDHVDQWRQIQVHSRDYNNDVVKRIHQPRISDNFDIVKYGALSHAPERYPLFYLKTKNWDASKPSILIEGGVHGYEPSGILASIQFAEDLPTDLSGKFNFVVFVCMSPWGYEMDHRWNYMAQDPNRGHVENSDIEECQLFMNAIKNLNTQFNASIDLHETPDRDITLRIMRASRFGSPLSENYLDIPQGFYLVVDTHYQNKPNDFASTIILEVATEVDIAQNELVLDIENDKGAIYIDILGLGATWLRENKFSKYASTTEVYSNPIGPEKSIDAQLAAIRGTCKFLDLNM